MQFNGKVLTNGEKTTKAHCITQYILQGGFGGTTTADSRIAVPCPSDRNALRNPPRQHVPDRYA